MHATHQPLLRALFLGVVTTGLVGGQAVQATISKSTQPEPTGATIPVVAPVREFEPARRAETPTEPMRVMEPAAEEAVAELVSYEQPAQTQKVYRICRVTAYCDRGTTACGVQSGVGQCAAPGDIPFGTTVYIPELNRTFVVTDRTHKRFRNSTVDIFIPAKSACKRFGCRYLPCEFTLPAERVSN